MARIRKDRRVACRFLVGNSEGHPGVDERVMLRLIWLRIGSGGGLL